MMRVGFLLFFLSCTLSAKPSFIPATPDFSGRYGIQGQALCHTAKNTLAYLAKGQAYDPLVIHEGKAVKIPLAKIKATLQFVCTHQQQLNDPAFLQKHFRFIRWYPDQEQSRQVKGKPLLAHLPHDRILMTKYYVHRALASATWRPDKPYPLYGLPKDEQHLTVEQASKQSALLRFRYGKQAILKGALQQKDVPVLGYFSREDIEAALMEGTIVADFGPLSGEKTFNVHRCNEVPYDKNKTPYSQERYWYFKEVDGVKGYGKDADHKITVMPQVTFAADLAQLGLGKLLFIQYKDKAQKTVSQLGLLADTGGAFTNNLYQVDYLAGSYFGLHEYQQAARHLPDYVAAYFMVLKD